MISYKTDWNLIAKDHVDNKVRLSNESVKTDMSVTIGMEGPQPQPAAGIRLNENLLS